MLSELLEGGAHAFGVGLDFRGIYHKSHTVNLVFEAWILHIAHSVRQSHWPIWTELGKRNVGITKKQFMLRLSMLLA